MVNRSVAWADWDEDLLSIELIDLKGLDFDLSLTGFDDEELARLLAAQDIAGALCDEDAAPAPPQTPISALGDLWLLGPRIDCCVAMPPIKKLSSDSWERSSRCSWSQILPMGFGTILSGEARRRQQFQANGQGE